MEQNHDMDEIDLLELARLLWSHALQIAAAGIAAAVICLLVCTFVLTPRYQASVNLIVNSRQDGNASITSDNINSARNLIDTYAVIIKSNIVLNDVIEQLGLDMTYRQLLACISVDGVGSTQIMSITVTNEDPALAGKIVQAIAETCRGTKYELPIMLAICLGLRERDPRPALVGHRRRVCKHTYRHRRGRKRHRREGAEEL